jgi:6-pyruvoyl-tetrahydropterin synthase
MALEPTDTQMGGHSMILVGARSHFCCGHKLPQHKEVHGHSYEVWAYSGEPCDAEEWQFAVTMICGELDHTMLNDKIPVPTMENIALYIANEIGAIKVRIIRPVEGLEAELTIDSFIKCPTWTTEIDENVNRDTTPLDLSSGR